jgi:hypothetical protein
VERDRRRQSVPELPPTLQRHHRETARIRSRGVPSALTERKLSIAGTARN